MPSPSPSPPLLLLHGPQRHCTWLQRRELRGGAGGERACKRAQRWLGTAVGRQGMPWVPRLQVHEWDRCAWPAAAAPATRAAAALPAPCASHSLQLGTPMPSIWPCPEVLQSERTFTPACVQGGLMRARGPLSRMEAARRPGGGAAALEPCSWPGLPPFWATCSLCQCPRGGLCTGCMPRTSMPERRRRQPGQLAGGERF